MGEWGAEVGAGMVGGAGEQGSGVSVASSALASGKGRASLRTMLTQVGGYVTAMEPALSVCPSPPPPWPGSQPGLHRVLRKR